MTSLIEIKDIIAIKTGLVEFGKDDEMLLKFFNTRLKETHQSSIRHYINYLSSGDTDSIKELKTIAVELSNTETFFFRDHGQMSLLREKILPILIDKNRGTKSIKIWSAACSSGEEIYSIAMILSELLREETGWSLQLIGTDINGEALEKARKGHFSPWSFRAVPEIIKREYFTLVKNQFHLKDKIKKMADFKFFNLISEIKDFPGAHKENFDLIICRNVFIYFNEVAINKSVDNFIKALKPEGYLLTGHSELANRHFDGLTLIPFAESFIFYKTTSKVHRQFGTNDNKKEEHQEPLEQIPVRKRGLQVELPPLHEVSSKTVASKIESKSSENDEQAMLALARSYADSGKLEDAKVLCDKINATNSFMPESYFLLAQIANEEGEIENAVALLNKVLYLDHEFFPASIELAAIYDFIGEKLKALKCRQTALAQLKKLDPESTVTVYHSVKVSSLINEIAGSTGI
jgi:chemotaxis protein methyltransferase CheR